MPYYSAPDGKLFFFDTEPDQGSIRADLAPITDEEAAEIGKPSISMRKAAMRSEVTALVREKQQGGAPTPIGVVDSDTDSRNKLNGAVLMAMLAAQASQPFSITWTLADNSNVTLDGAGMIRMASAVGSYVAACHASGQVLKAAIKAATDHSALDMIDLEAGWP